MFAQDRAQMRAVFFRAWHHYRSQRPLEGIEKIIVDVALRHPEYHPILDDPDRYQDSNYLPELGVTNPFLHLGMHVAIEEQLATDRPPGVRAHYQQLAKKTGDAHAAQHAMLECLGEALWQAQRAGIAPSDTDYLACLARAGGAQPSQA